MYKSTTPGKSSEIWAEALKILTGWLRHPPLSCYSATNSSQDPRSKPKSACFTEASKQGDWETELICYIRVLIGLQAASLSDWAKVKGCLEAIESLCPRPGILGLLQLYLSGVYEQGKANLDKALKIFEDPRFEIKPSGQAKASAGNIEHQLSILAALNRIWIMQDPSNRNDSKTGELTELLRPLCLESSDPDIRTAYNLVLATIQTNPALSINQVKRHIQQSLNGAQQTSNTQFLSIALNIMRCRLFENVVGEQALKSAKASAAQAKKTGNLLWMSVADGMLAQSLEMQGAVAESKSVRANGIRLANEALARTQC